MISLNHLILDTWDTYHIIRGHANSNGQLHLIIRVDLEGDNGHYFTRNDATISFAKVFHNGILRETYAPYYGNFILNAISNTPGVFRDNLGNAFEIPNCTQISMHTYIEQNTIILNINTFPLISV